MKKKVVRKVYECPECGSHRLLLRGNTEVTDLVRFDGTEYITYEWYDGEYIDDDDPTSDYMCGSCEAFPCIENEEELREYLETNGVEEEFEIEVPEDMKVEA